MKSIRYVPDVQLTLIDGSPLLTASGEPEKPYSQRYFLLSRVSDGGFLPQGQDSIEGIAFAISVRDTIEAQSHLVAERGFWLFEDAHHARLLSSARSAQYAPAIRHCLLPFLTSLRDATDPPRKEEPALKHHE